MGRGAGLTFRDVDEGSLRAVNCYMGNGSGGEKSDAEDEPDVNMFEIGCAGEGGQGFRVEGDKGEQGGEAHHATVLEVVESQEEGGVTNKVEEDGWEEGGEEVVCRAAVEAEGEFGCATFVL